MASNTISHQQEVDSAEFGTDEIPKLIDHDTGKKSETNIEHYIQYNDELEMIPEESDKTFQLQRKVTVMKQTPYHSSQGTWKMSSSTWPLMTHLRTR